MQVNDKLIALARDLTCDLLRFIGLMQFIFHSTCAFYPGQCYQLSISVIFVAFSDSTTFQWEYNITLNNVVEIQIQLNCFMQRHADVSTRTYSYRLGHIQYSFVKFVHSFSERKMSQTRRCHFLSKQQHVWLKMSEDKVHLSSKLMNSGVLDLFEPLSSNDANDNINGTVELLNYFAQNDVSCLCVF